MAKGFMVLHLAGNAGEMDSVWASSTWQCARSQESNCDACPIYINVPLKY